MNSIQDRISAATRAAADTVRPDSIPPLRLPADGRADGRARSRRGPSRARWLAPAAAAIAVFVAILAVVTVVSRHGRQATPVTNSPVAPYVTSGQVPPYFVALAATGAASKSPADAEVHATADGRRLATVRPSVPGGTIVAVTAAADDRTFVLAEQPWAKRGVQQYQPHSFYLLRLGPAGQVSALTKLPMTVPGNSTLQGLALSADGRRLAIAVRLGGVAGQNRLTVYTLGSGAARTWLAPRSGSAGIGQGPDDARALSWTADGRTLAFDWITNGNVLAVRLLSVDGAGGDLLADSRQVVSWALPGGLVQPVTSTATGPFKPVGDAIITPDGSAVVTAAGQGRTQRAGNAITWLTTQTAVQEYSVTTGKLLRTFGIARTKPAELHAGVLWSDPAGGVVIGLTTGSRVAVISGSHIVPLNRPATVLASNGDAGTW
jgi:hypothetical protein